MCSFAFFGGELLTHFMSSPSNKASNNGIEIAVITSSVEMVKFFELPIADIN